MATALPSRFRSRNIPRATSAPSVLHLVASREAGPDRTEVVLVSDLEGVSLAWVRRHAAAVLDSVARRNPGRAVDVQVFAGDSVPVLICTAGGAS